MTTTVKIHEDTKLLLDRYREHGESYDRTIRKVIMLANEDDAELKDEVIEAIEKSRKRDKLYTSEEIRKLLGLDGTPLRKIRKKRS